MTAAAEFLRRPDGAAIAYEQQGGDGPGVVFLHGLKSDRRGTKAEALAQYCRQNGRAFLRFDMFGHGDSAGRFEDGSISRWVDDTLAVLDGLTSGPQILVGSSMGGWVMLKAAVARPDRVAGLVGIAAAPDFTEDLMWAGFSAAQRAALHGAGFIDVPSEYDGGPYRITRHFIEDGRGNVMLGGEIPITCPVRLLHGQRDADVPWETALRVAEKLEGDDVHILLVKDGDHRLSRPADLQRLCTVVDELVKGQVADAWNCDRRESDAGLRRGARRHGKHRRYAQYAIQS